MAQRLVLVGPDLRRLVSISLTLSSVSPNITIREAGQPLAQLASLDSGAPAAIVDLPGRVNLVDLRAGLTAHQATRFLFLVPSMPPSPALARIVRSGGGEIMSRNAPDIVIAATLIALLAGKALTA
jgi:hypothetical protein